MARIHSEGSRGSPYLICFLCFFLQPFLLFHFFASRLLFLFGLFSVPFVLVSSFSPFLAPYFIFFPAHLCCVLDLLRHTPFAHENSRIEEWAVSRAAEGDASMGDGTASAFCVMHRHS